MDLYNDIDPAKRYHLDRAGNKFVTDMVKCSLLNRLQAKIRKSGACFCQLWHILTCKWFGSEHFNILIGITVSQKHETHSSYLDKSATSNIQTSKEGIMQKRGARLRYQKCALTGPCRPLITCVSHKFNSCTVEGIFLHEISASVQVQQVLSWPKSTEEGRVFLSGSHLDQQELGNNLSKCKQTLQ